MEIENTQTETVYVKITFLASKLNIFMLHIYYKRK